MPSTRDLIRCAAAAALALLAACSGGPTGDGQANGGGSEIVCIRGSAVDTTLTAVAGAMVRLRPADYLATPVFAAAKRAAFLADTVTDTAGCFSISNVDTGSYVLEISDTARGIGTSVLCVISSRDTVLELQHTALKATAVIHGRIPHHYGMDSTRVNVQVFGLERNTLTDSAGEFTLRGIPEGSYSLHFISESVNYAPYDVGGITVVGGQRVEAPPITWPIKGLGIDPADSAALRAILDSNGLMRIPLQQVMVFDQTTRRITELQLQYLHLRTLTSRIGDFAELHSLVAEHDTLTSVPAQIGQLKRLRELNLRFNFIAGLPPEIGTCDSLENIDVSTNRLMAVPPQIGALSRLSILNVGGNDLAALPPELGTCTALGWIIAFGNRLSTLPAELAGLGGLTFLDVQINRIDSLPPQLFALGTASAPLTINIDANQLCDSLSDSAAAWIDLHSMNQYWRGTQCK